MMDSMKVGEMAAMKVAHWVEKMGTWLAALTVHQKVDQTVAVKVVGLEWLMVGPMADWMAV